MKRILFLAIAILSLSAVCQAQSKAKQPATAKSTIEVLYFHGKQRCITCKSIEALTKEVLTKNYSNQLKSGKIVFKTIDISTKEGEKLADKYEVTWSSLLLVKNGRVVNLTDTGFSYAKSQPEIFKTELKKRLNILLK